MDEKPNVLKVSTTTDIDKLAGAIAKLLKQNDEVNLVAVGAGSVNQAVKAIALTRRFVYNEGMNIICIPTFTSVDVANEEKTAIKFIVRK